MRAFATGDAHLDARIEALNKDTENLLNELREARLMLDGVKVTAAPPERAELSIETALGRAQQIYHRAQGLKQSTERFRENTK